MNCRVVDVVSCAAGPAVLWLEPEIPGPPVPILLLGAPPHVEELYGARVWLDNGCLHVGDHVIAERVRLQPREKSADNVYRFRPDDARPWRLGQLLGDP